MRGKGVLAGLERERERESTHVCITFLRTCACQTSHCVRLGTPVMLTDSDSPRPDQQALAHCAVRALLCGKRAKLRGSVPQPLPPSRPEGQVWTCSERLERGEDWWQMCECVCSAVDWYSSCCQPLLLPLALLFAHFHPGLPRLHL